MQAKPALRQLTLTSHAQVQRRPALPSTASCSLPGGGENQRKDTKGVCGQLLQDGQRKGGSLAAAGVGGADDVPACQDSRYAPLLHLQVGGERMITPQLRLPPAMGCHKMLQGLQPAAQELQCTSWCPQLSLLA